MQRDLRLYDEHAYEPEPSEPTRPRLHVPRQEPHYALVVLPLRVRDDPEEVKRYRDCFAAIQDLDLLAKNPKLFARLKVDVVNPAWIAVIDSTGFEVRRAALLRIVKPPAAKRSWWRKLWRWW